MIFGTYLIISFEVLGWRKLVLIKYYCKINDRDPYDPFKHPILGALLRMVLHALCNTLFSQQCKQYI